MVSTHILTLAIRKGKEEELKSLRILLRAQLRWGTYPFSSPITSQKLILCSYLKGSQKCKCILSWGWPGLQLKMESFIAFRSDQIRSVAQSCLTLCDPMNRSTPGLPVHHQLPEFTQTHVHWVGDAIQPSHPLSSPSPPTPNPSQHQSLFQSVNSSHEVAKVLEFQL